MDENFDLIAADLAIQGDTIAQVSPDLSGEESVDCTGYTIVPGFVDIHIHACVGSDTCDADPQGLAKMCAHLASKGVTSFCPTTMTISHDGIENALSTVKQAMDQPPKGARIAGVNMEGPYISIHKKGAQAGDYVKIRIC